MVNEDLLNHVIIGTDARDEAEQSYNIDEKWLLSLQEVCWTPIVSNQCGFECITGGMIST